MTNTHSRRHLAMALAVGATALIAPLALAQDAATGGTTATVTTGTTVGDMTTGSMASATPTLVTGNVLRYYTDGAGYVTAMDVQTPNGVQMVRFAPGMGERVYTTYPVNSTANVWVTSRTRRNTTRYDVVGVGTDMPGSWSMPSTATAGDLLSNPAWVVAGAPMITIGGRLRNLVVNRTGEVVGLVLDNVMRNYRHGTLSADSTSGTMGANPTSAAVTSGADSGLMNNWALVRVPREMRQIDPGMNGTERVTPLFKNSRVSVTGWREAPRYGMLSTYGERVAATAIVVNGRAVSPIGFPLMSPSLNRSLFSWDVGGTTKSAEELNAATMGYSTYDPTGVNAGTGMMGGTGTSGGTSTTGTTTGP